MATDRKPRGRAAGRRRCALRERGVRLELGRAPRARPSPAPSLVVVSPGRALGAARARGGARGGRPRDRRDRARLPPPRRAASRRSPGTKGKSTTTAALGAMLREAGFDARVGGNIGAPLVGLVEGSTPATAFAVEVSSFQLEGTDALPPARRGLAQPLARPPRPPPLARGLRRGQGARLREPDGRGLGGRERGRPRRARAGARRAALAQAPLPRDGRAARRRATAPSSTGGLARLRLDGREETLFRRDEVVLPGRAPRRRPARRGGGRAPPRRPGGGHRPRGARPSAGVEHVLEHVATIDGVAYYNDSKATNVEAARRSLEAFAQPVLVDPRRPLQGRRLRRPRPGAARPRPPRAGDRRGARARRRRRSRARVPVDPCASLREAVERARAAARARRRRAPRPRLLVLRHVRGLRRPRPRVQGRGPAARATGAPGGARG